MTARLRNTTSKPRRRPVGFMSSAIPYDPADFENNNPFAEPVEHQLQVLPVREEEPQDPQQETHPAGEPVHNTYGGQEEPAMEGAQLSDEELRKLIPERYTSRYSIVVNLRAVEKNKAANPILRFDATVTGLARYRQHEYKDIRRTYHEAVKFNKYLSMANLEVFVPTLPSSVTSYPPGGDEETHQLMEDWQEWFDRVTGNPILARDEEFMYFIESDYGYSVINSAHKTSVASGLIRKTLKQLSAPYDPYVELAEFRPMVKMAYLEFQKLSKALDRNCKTERAIAAGVSELAIKLSGLSEFERTHPGMKNMWEKLARVINYQSDSIYTDQSHSMGVLFDGLRTFTNDFFEIKEALTNRHLIMRELVQAELQTQTKHQHAARIKNKSSLDPIKVDEAIRLLEYATKVEDSLNLQVKRISGEMMMEKKEVILHTEQKIRRLLKRYTLNKVEHHRKNLKHLEAVRLDIRIVDNKGGLSRLNRDNLDSFKHNLHPSQSTQGDSWSARTFRSVKEALPVPLKEETVDAKNAASLLGVATF